MALDKAGLSAKLHKMSNLSGVRAVAPGVKVAAEHRQEASFVAARQGLDPVEAVAFEKAGWTFVKSSLAPEDEANHDVVVDGDGHLKVVAHAINVKFDPTLSQEAAEVILGRYGLGIRRKLGFSPNLFLVDGAQENIVSKAQSLNQLDSVVYAEPVLIEPIQGR
jgi:hypothetical protein